MSGTGSLVLPATCPAPHAAGRMYIPLDAGFSSLLSARVVGSGSKFMEQQRPDGVVQRRASRGKALLSSSSVALLSLVRRSDPREARAPRDSHNQLRHVRAINGLLVKASSESDSGENQCHLIARRVGVDSGWGSDLCTRPNSVAEEVTKSGVTRGRLASRPPPVQTPQMSTNFVDVVLIGRAGYILNNSSLHMSARASILWLAVASASQALATRRRPCEAWRGARRAGQQIGSVSGHDTADPPHTIQGMGLACIVRLPSSSSSTGSSVSIWGGSGVESGSVLRV